MTYAARWTQNGHESTATGSRAQIQALVDYLQRTYRIRATVAQMHA